MKHASTVISQCKAKDPLTCPYHATYVLLQKAAESGNVEEYLRRKSIIEQTEKHNALKKLEKQKIAALQGGDEKTYLKIRKQEKKVKPIPAETTGFKEARSYNGFATHIVNLADCSEYALCGTKWLDTSSEITPEQVEANLSKEHKSFFYCGGCFEKFTGKPRPSRVSG